MEVIVLVIILFVYYAVEMYLWWQYISVVQVSDQLHNTTTSVIVNVLDDNDNAPVFIQSGYEVIFYAARLYPSPYFGKHFTSRGKRGDYQNCSVLYCVLNLCTVISTLTWAVLTVVWIWFCHTGPISLCIDLFVFICVYFVWFCFLLHVCCIIVSTMGWTWWDWSLIFMTYLPSVLWHCWLGHFTHKNSSPIWPINQPISSKGQYLSYAVWLEGK